MNVTKEEAINYLSKCRERAQDCVDDFERDFPRQKSAWRRDVEVYDMAIAALNGQPVVHGRWKFGKNHGEFVETECTACGSLLLVKWIDELSNYRYCPNCGARMDGDGNAD